MEAINITLNWDYSGNRYHIGSFNEDMFIFGDKSNAEFNLHMEVVVENFEGGYWSPPEFNTVSEDIVISDLVVLDKELEKLEISVKQEINIINKIRDNINYE